MIAFNASDAALVRQGKITVTWRLWKYPHVKPGRAYRFGPGALEIDEVRAVQVADVTDADAHEVGLPDRAALLELCRSHTLATLTPTTELYRVAFHYADQPPPTTELSIEQLHARLQRLDGAHPWTRAALEDIAGGEAAQNPQSFKEQTRKLKALGLIERQAGTFEVTPLGQRYLDSHEEPS